MNTTRRSLIALAASSAAVSHASSWFSPSLGATTEFFDAQHYANFNPDLVNAGMRTYTALYNHWLGWGKREGRLAHPLFHALSYNARYPDLQRAFGGDNIKLYNHYVTSGQYEGRNARANHVTTATLGDVSIGASTRCAGAVDSLFSNGIELINSFDHGRQMQFSCSDSYYEGCFNPTQAGSASDGKGWPSTSQLLSRSASANVLSTRTQCAYWGLPDLSIASQGTACGQSPAAGPLSNYIVDTRYSLRANGEATIVDYELTMTAGSNIPAGRFAAEILGAYVVPLFTQAYEVLPSGAAQPRPPGTVGTINVSAHERDNPVLLFNPTGTHAIGIYCPTQAGTLTRYGAWRWAFGQNEQTNDCTKLGIVRRYSDALTAGQVIKSNAKIVLGSAGEVHRVLRTLIASGGMI